MNMLYYKKKLKPDLKKGKITLKICQNFLENSIIDNQYEIFIKKENNFIMTIMEIVKKVILILQKLEDVQKEKKVTTYENEIGSIPEYEPHSPTESEEQEEEKNYKIKKRELPPKQIHKPRQIKKAITKSIKM